MLTYRYRRQRSEIFREMAANTRNGLKEYNIDFRPNFAELRRFWQTADSCAVIRQATQSIIETRREMFR